MTAFRLTGLTNPVVGVVFHIREGSTTLGRADDNGLVVQDASVSRRHAIIRVEGDTYTVLDLKSTNGTFVNNVPVSIRALHAGDTLRLGDVAFRFEPSDATLLMTPPPSPDSKRRAQRRRRDFGTPTPQAAPPAATPHAAVPEAHPPAQMAPEARTRKTEPRSLACSGEASRMAVFKLTGVTDPLIGWTFPILGDAFTIGCDDDNDLVIAHASVSRHHAVIRVEGDACTVLDLHSPRGTFVNDVRVSARPLHAGDTLRLGDVALRFQAVDAPSASPRPAHLAEPALEGDPVTPAQPAPASEPPAQIPPPEPTTATRPVEPQTNTPVARTASPPSPVAEAIESEVARVDRELGRSGEDILGQCRRITCFAGPDKGKTVPILVKPVFVGSHSNSDFQIKLWDIPAHHARIAPGVGKCVLLTDLGGLPGVTVKGQRIRSDTAHTVTLNPGDTFEIGEAKFLFHL